MKMVVDADLTSGNLVRTVTMGNCAPRVTFEACEWTFALANTVGIEKMGRKICDEPPPGLRIG